MGVCHSSASVKTKASAVERDGEKLDSNLNSCSSRDLAAIFSKLGGGTAQERLLRQIPRRMFSNGASRVASLYTQQGKKGVNQDAMIAWENFGIGRDGNATFCGVFDGHGPYGHMVAKKVRDVLPIFLRMHWEINPQSGENYVNENEGMNRFDDFMDDDNDDNGEDDDDDCSMEFEDNGRVPKTYVVHRKSVSKAFKLMDRELKLHPNIDCYCSGTTAVVLVMEGQDLIIGNVGDSRAVLATRDKDNALVALQMTVDLKPNLPREAARIQKCKGRVFALQDEPEVARLWLPNIDSPGLAMARAFGDFCLKDFGLISVPDVYYHHITDRDEFVILATDGVWDVLSNKEAVDIVASAPSRGTAARAIVECATRAWRYKYPTSKIDDCAVICLFLDRRPVPDAPNAHDDIHDKVDSKAGKMSAPTDSDIGKEITAMAGEGKKPSTVSLNQSKRRLGECISNADDREEWTALEGVTRVNSLVNVPRFLPALGRKRV